VVPLIEILFGKKISMKLLSAAFFSLFGIAFLEYSPESQLGPPDINDLICFFQPLSFGISYVRIEEYLRRLPTGSEKALSAIQVQVTAIVSLIWAISMHYGNGQETIALSFLQEPYSLIALLHTGLLSTALTVYITNVALKEVPASESSVIIGTEPLWAAIFGSLLLSETMSSNEVFGGLLILMGCFIGTQANSVEESK